MKKIIIMILAGMLSLTGMLSGADAAEKKGLKTLDEAIGETVIIPFDYQGKALNRGVLYERYQEYQLAQKNGSVLVPIRLMGELASYADANNGEWEAVWKAKSPDVVILQNVALKKSVTFTLNSKMMKVNGKDYKMEVAPQKVNGRIMLPLRSAAVAIGKQIQWLDGLIIIGDEELDLKAPKTSTLKDQIFKLLTDPRKPVDSEKNGTPLMKNGNTLYFYKAAYTNMGATMQLFKQTDGRKPEPVKLQGNPYISETKTMGNEMFYVTVVDGQSWLYSFSFDTGNSGKIGPIKSWVPGFGWIGEIRSIDNELYIILHVGDLTMGGESLYKIENGSLTEISSAKSFINYIKTDIGIITSEFSPMDPSSPNLNLNDPLTGESSAYGQTGYTYGLNRHISGESSGYSYSSGMFEKDGYLYLVGYKEDDLQETGSIYKINLADRTQTKLVSSVESFWLENNRIYYFDSGTGYLNSVGLDGTNNVTLAKRKVLQTNFYNGSVYYTAASKSDKVSFQGELYRYNLKTGQETKLSNQPVHTLFSGKTGFYYVSDGISPGIYKIGSDGKSIRLVKDRIHSAILTDSGMIYTLLYSGGIYTTK
ncbi:DUF5050 domain-containing protein [Paenibacillus sp. DYY-L-2]|uniref:DUF5050 domain-containing protein n=1 Tax=Paenibacillus sp. DYY-L-2 TaxID=3447013 RepID=UPI003F4F439D